MPGLVAQAQNPDAGVSVPESHRSQLSTSVTIVDHDGNEIGFIQSITSTDNRPVTAVRHLNAADAGRIVEGAPSPATKTLAVTGFALYKKQNDGSIIQRIGGSVTRKTMKTLEEQSIPFNLIESVTHPATGEEETIIYHDCWLTNHSRPVNIGTALVSENCSIFVTWTDGD